MQWVFSTYFTQNEFIVQNDEDITIRNYGDLYKNGARRLIGSVTIRRCALVGERVLQGGF